MRGRRICCAFAVLLAAGLLAAQDQEGQAELPPSVLKIVTKHQWAARREKRTFEAAVQVVQDQLLKDLEAEQDRLTNRRAVEQAHATSELVKEVRAAGIQQNLLVQGHILGLSTNEALFEEAGAVVKITSRSPAGFVIGELPQGAKVQFQYVSGSWKHFGNVATESPDAAKAGEKDASRLCLAARDPRTGRTRTLVVIPGGTKNKPFVWTAPTTIPDAVLRINDTDGNFDTNPDKDVKYRIKVTID